MKNLKKLFSKERTDTHDVYRVFGVKVSLRHGIMESQETIASKYIQDTLDLSLLKRSKKIIVFFIPAELKIGGGIMSIFSLCQTARDVSNADFCCLSTLPNGNTYVINDWFYNNEKILRFDQIVNNALNIEELIIHIPEYCSSTFYKILKKSDVEFLKRVPNLQINIMNQNINLMPEPEDLRDLYKLTNNITQSIAHNSSATQEICNKWGIPTHLFSVNTDLSYYKYIDFDNKEKIIVLSPDDNSHKTDIVSRLRVEFPDFELVTVKNMTFKAYMDLISRAYFTITFGEGFDGYFIQPLYVGSLGFSVYNENFFPNEDWKRLLNVYLDYSDMLDHISNDMNRLLRNKVLYIQAISAMRNKIDMLYNYEYFKDNLRRFFDKQYDFYPETS